MYSDEMIRNAGPERKKMVARLEKLGVENIHENKMLSGGEVTDE